MIKKLLLTVVGLYGTLLAYSQSVPTPTEHFGFYIGKDYHLANYTQTEAYFQKVAEASDRVQLVNIGQTEEGRNQYILVVTSPNNHAKLQEYKSISQRLARAEGLTAAQAKELSLKGKPVVWIDGGLHSNEMVGTHQLIETLYQLASRTDDETLDILDKVIVLLAQVNPDGQELVANWYMKEADSTQRRMNIPRLYQKYVGHDNNRDFYMMNMKETTNISLQQYVEWMPQIIYNHHQPAPRGTTLAGPPYRDPFNFVYDPLLITGIDGVAAAMINRLNAEDKPGYTRLSGSYYSTWWNGGLRTTPYYHNMIGILTEMVGSPEPMQIEVLPNRLIPNNATPNPVLPQKWHFKKSIDYSLSLNYAVLNYARRFGDELLFNIYKMGQNSIEKGSKDYWSLQPKKAAQLLALAGQNSTTNNLEQTVSKALYDSVYLDPALRDARGYILSAEQPDFPTVIAFINALSKSGIQIHRATSAFSVAGKSYPEGSFVVKTAQAFRPHVVDMFEPQNHPNDFQYPGGPPVRPYDAAGWTLALQMGVQFDRILDHFEGPFEQLSYGQIVKSSSTIVPSKTGYVIKRATNQAFKIVNQLLKNNISVYEITQNGTAYTKGDFYVAANAEPVLQKINANTGIAKQTLVAVRKKPASLHSIKALRIGLVDYYGGSMPSGWTRWLLEQFDYDFSLVYPQEIDKGNLKNKYDVLLFIGPGVPAHGAPNRFLSTSNKATNIPADYSYMLGSISTEKSIPSLKAFAEEGGTLLAVGASTSLAYHLGLPIKNGLTEMNAAGKEQPLSGEKYYIPGSILEVKTDTTLPATKGLTSRVNVMFNNSPVFVLTPDAMLQGIQPIAWFDQPAPLKSGWAWGQSYLFNKTAAFDAPIGKGKLVAYGPEVIFRAQSHGSFKLLFNYLYN